MVLGIVPLFGTGEALKELPTVQHVGPCLTAGASSHTLGILTVEGLL